MAFRENSAWLMAAVLLVGGLAYFLRVASLSTSLASPSPPHVPAVALYILALVMVAVLGHILLPLFAPREAGEFAGCLVRPLLYRWPF